MVSIVLNVMNVMRVMSVMSAVRDTNEGTGDMMSVWRELSVITGFPPPHYISPAE